MSARKIVEVSSFDWPGGIPLPRIVDDPEVRRKTASSPAVEAWKDFKPPKGHSLVHVNAMGTFEALGPNSNGDAFEHAFLKRAHPTFVTDAHLFRNHKAFYKTASGKIVEDPDLREGSVVASMLWDRMQRVELLLAARHDKCADWLVDVEADRMVAFSMGLEIDFDECSKCGQKTYSPPEGYCKHVRKNASHPYGMNSILPDGSKCFVFNRNGRFKDISKVGVGADLTAFHLRKVASAASGAVGGAELARLYEEANLAADGASFRMKTAKKMSAAEKRIMASGVVLACGCPEEEPVLPESVVKALVGAGGPAAAASWLAERRMALGPRAFLKHAYASDGADLSQEDVDAVARKVAFGGFAWAESNGLSDAVAANGRWDPGKTAPSLPVPWPDEAMAAAAASLDGGATVKTAMPSGFREPPAELTPAQTAMAVEYLSYRLSLACRAEEEGWPGGALSAI